MKKIIRYGFLVVLLDQISKLIVANTITINETHEVIKNFFYITYIKNEGAAWNILEGQSLFLIVLGFLAIIFIFFLIKDEPKLKKIHIISYSLLLGGIVGNLIDRIKIGSVIDFIYFNIFNFPVFNISDFCIVLGVMIFTYETLRSDIYADNNSANKNENRQIFRRKNK